MDMGQIMQAAQGGDPQAAAFLQQLLAGGAGRGGGAGLLEAIKPQPAPSFGSMPEAGEGPLAAFDKAQELMGGMMGEAATTAPIQGSGAGAATTTPSGITPATGTPPFFPPQAAQVAPQAADPNQQDGGGLMGFIARLLGQGG